MPGWAWASILLAVLIAAAAVSLFSAHIPGVRNWTNAAPLEGESTWERPRLSSTTSKAP